MLPETNFISFLYLLVQGLPSFLGRELQLNLDLSAMFLTWPSPRRSREGSHRRSGIFGRMCLVQWWQHIRTLQGPLECLAEAGDAFCLPFRHHWMVSFCFAPKVLESQKEAPEKSCLPFDYITLWLYRYFTYAISRQGRFSYFHLTGKDTEVSEWYSNLSPVTHSMGRNWKVNYFLL